MADRKGEAGEGRIERESARERHERALHDEARSSLGAPDEEFRLKDARERIDAGSLKRRAPR